MGTKNGTLWKGLTPIPHACYKVSMEQNRDEKDLFMSGQTIGMLFHR